MYGDTGMTQRVLHRTGEYLCLAAVLTLGIWLRFDDLGKEGFWGDERCYVYLDESNPTDYHAHSHGFDWYIRLYALSLHPFGLSITDEFTFRALSATVSSIAILLIYLAGRLLRMRGGGYSARCSTR